MNETRSQNNKKCPYCGVPLSLNADSCFSCKKTVGRINKHGMARKPPNYWSYITCVLAWVAFFLYLRWAFS